MTTTKETETPDAVAIVRAPQTQQHTQAIEPQNFGELKALAQHAARSRFFGGAGDESQALVLMMRGRDLGLSYAQALAAFHVISGKPTLSADAMVAVCLARPDLCEYFRHVSSDDTQATFATKRVGEPEQRETYTMADAIREELASKAMWKKFPKRMLKARAKANLARDTFPELLLGIYSPEEMAAATESPRAASLELVGEVVREMAPAKAAPANTIPTPPPSSEPGSEPQPKAEPELPNNPEQAEALDRLTAALDEAASLNACKTIATDAKATLKGEFLDEFRARHAKRYVAIQAEEKAGAAQ